MARKKMGAEEPREVISTEITINKNTFLLLNREKLGRVLNWLDGKELPPEKDSKGQETSEYAALMSVKDMQPKAATLALYDRLGGAIRFGDRMLKTGVFWDVKAKVPVEKPDLSEESYNDQYVLVPKKTRKSEKTESPEERIKRLESKKSNLDREENVE